MKRSNGSARLGVKIAICASLMATLLGGTAVLPAAATPARTAAPATVTCEFPTYQYVFSGRDGTFRDVPGGAVKGYLATGDLLNSGFAPNTTGWIQGNFYTWDGHYKGTGWALRDYFHYLRSWC